MKRSLNPVESGDSVNSGSGMKTAKALLEEAIKNALFYNRTYGHDPNK